MTLLHKMNVGPSRRQQSARLIAWSKVLHILRAEAAPERTSATIGQPSARAIFRAATQSSGRAIWATTMSPLWAPARMRSSSNSPVWVACKLGERGIGAASVKDGVDMGISAVKGLPDLSHLSRPCNNTST